jgi:hypothetical protein
MGWCNDSSTKVVAHYVFSPGDYRALSSFGEKDNLQKHHVMRTDEGTAMTFTLAKKSINDYTKSLKIGQNIFLTLAYSNHKDFKHHSEFRKTIKIKL